MSNSFLMTILASIHLSSLQNLKLKFKTIYSNPIQNDLFFMVSTITQIFYYYIIDLVGNIGKVNSTFSFRRVDKLILTNYILISTSQEIKTYLRDHPALSR